MRNLAPSRPSSGAAARIGSSAIRDLLALTRRPEVISLAGGLPSPAAFPTDELAAVTAEVLAADPTAALQYGPTEGVAALRHWVARCRPAPAEAAEVLITHGAQQAIELVARATVAPGETVAIADPGYVGALQAFRAAGADLLAVPTDSDGLCVDRLADRLAAGARPRLVYVVPEFDNPGGTTLAEERRAALVTLADRYGFWVLEDDPYGDLRWQGRRPRPLAGRSDRVVAVGTTSKVLAPGLRVGWVVAERALHDELVVLKQAADLHTSSLGQHLAARLLVRPGFLDHQLDGLRARYRAQAETLVSALGAHLGDRARPPVPAGGMFLWLTLPGVDTAALLPRAVAQGMAFVPGPAFAVRPGAHADALRLSFATAGPPQLTEAARRLGAALTA